MLGALRNAVLDSPHGLVQYILQQKVFKFSKSKPYQYVPLRFVGRVNPSNGVEF